MAEPPTCLSDRAWVTSSTLWPTWAGGLVFSVPEYKIENHALPDYVFSVCRYASRANEHQSNQYALTRTTATCSWLEIDKSWISLSGRMKRHSNRCVKTTFFLVSEETHSSEEGRSHKKNLSVVFECPEVPDSDFPIYMVIWNQNMNLLWVLSLVFSIFYSKILLSLVIAPFVSTRSEPHKLMWNSSWLGKRRVELLWLLDWSPYWSLIPLSSLLKMKPFESVVQERLTIAFLFYGVTYPSMTSETIGRRKRKFQLVLLPFLPSNSLSQWPDPWEWLTGGSVTGATIRADRAVGTGRSESTRLVPKPGADQWQTELLTWVLFYWQA